MESWESFELNQRVIDDFSARTLAAIPNDLARLIHLAMLRDLGSGKYHHEGLEGVYSSGAVDQGLRYCHEQIFERVLETPLERQESDLLACFEGMEGGTSEIACRWLELEFYRLLVPLQQPDYLRDLFCSNLRALLQLAATQPVVTASTA